MAIYLPPYFCGEDAQLKLKTDLIWQDLHIPCGELCLVEDLIGYTYVISPISSQGKIKHRMKNSIMANYFEIIEKGNEPWNEENKTAIQKGAPKSKMVKDIKIYISRDEVIMIDKGKTYYCLKKENDREIYWELIEENTFETTLKVKDKEYREYFSEC